MTDILQSAGLRNVGTSEVIELTAYDDGMINLYIETDDSPALMGAGGGNVDLNLSVTAATELMIRLGQMISAINDGRDD